MADEGTERTGKASTDLYMVEADPPSTLTRRGFLKVGAIVAAGAWMAALGGSVIRSITSRSDEGPAIGRNVFVYHVPAGERPWYETMDGKEVFADEFPVGQTAKVFVNNTKAILLRLEEDALIDRTGSELGFVAFDSKCTHLGCQVYFAKGETPVGDYPLGIIYCPCHQGAFDPYRGAKVLYGPPPQPLVRIPLRVAGGRLEAI